MGKRALFQGKVALFGVVQPKNLRHYFGKALFEVALFGGLLYVFGKFGHIWKFGTLRFQVKSNFFSHFM